MSYGGVNKSSVWDRDTLAMSYGRDVKSYVWDNNSPKSYGWVNKSSVWHSNSSISYGRVIMSSVWDSMMSKKNMGWLFYAAVHFNVIYGDFYLNCHCRIGLLLQRLLYTHQNSSDSIYLLRICVITFYALFCELDGSLYCHELTLVPAWTCKQSILLFLLIYAYISIHILLSQYPPTS